METIFVFDGINSDTALSEVVFPEAVPPAKMRDLSFSMANHKKAISLSENVFQLMRSIGVKGTSLNCRIV
jgi:hypothetical protein